jgi:hypothetical protein
LKAYVLTCTIISALLLLGTFFIWRAWSDKSRQLEAKVEELRTKNDDFTKVQGRYNRLRAMLGQGQWSQADLDQMEATFKSDAELAPLEQEFANLKTLFPANTNYSDKNLLKLPQQLLEIVRRRNEEVAGARAREKALEEKMQKEIEDHRQARDMAETAQKKAEADLANNRIQHEQSLRKVNGEKDEAVAKMEQNKAIFDKQYAEVDSENKRLTDVHQKDLDTIAQQSKQLQRFQNPDMAAPQGKIFRVADGGELVWINLGSKQGLRRGTPFSILDSRETSTTKAVPKARMIVEEVAEDYSRGRVEFPDDPFKRRNYIKNVVVEGDQVYSPAWRSGTKPSFALLGKMDMDDNFTDDIEQVRQLIINAGGKIDAELPAKGNETGKVTPNTNFLVIGSDVGNIDNPVSAERATLYSRFEQKARENGAIIMTLDKLMGFLKIDETSRTVGLGKNARPADFKVRNPLAPAVSPGTVSELYSRPPAKRGDDSSGLNPRANY